MILGTKLYWVEGPWRGKLAMAARPRGGDWLPDEIAAWHVGGVDSVLSLLEHGEEHELELEEEFVQVRAHGMSFRSFPIEDRATPHSELAFSHLLVELEADLSHGLNVALHCRQGIGRTGLVAAGLFVMSGLDPVSTLDRLSAARGATIPETQAQREWILHFAETYALPR